MKRIHVWLMVGVAAAGIAGAATECRAADGEKKKKNKLTLQAQRAGWLMGMQVGEDRTKPYPFVLNVDPEGDAKAKGIRPGDELIRFDGDETMPVFRIFDRVNRMPKGREVPIWVRRGVETIRFMVRVPRNPGAPPVDKPEEAKAAKTDETAGGATDAEKKKKTKKKGPIVIKPIPADEP
ncbi:MAG TPA: S1C family serine protease [Armatimonadota bacterium]|nr:S1C family serine protease [Armatimonadota bacterium]